MLPWNLTLPISFGDLGVSAGTTLATGLPRFSDDKRLARTGHFVEERQAVRLELAGRYSFRVHTHGQIT